MINLYQLSFNINIFFSIIEFRINMILFCLLTIIVQAQFSYSNFEQWPQICQIGKNQSPVSLMTKNTLQYCDFNKIKIGFLDGISKVMRQNNTIMRIKHKNSIVSIVDYDKNYIQYLGESIQIHQPAQHSIDNQQYELELQLKHRIFGGQINTYAVQFTYCMISILFSIDDSSENNVIDKLLNTDMINFSSIFTPIFSQGKLYHYHGSSTTPSCEQNVNWYVFNKILTIRTNQLSHLISKINRNGQNNRERQQINNRKIYLMDINCNSLVQFQSIGHQNNGLRNIYGLILIILLMIII